MKVYELINELQGFSGGEEVFCLPHGDDLVTLTVAGNPEIHVPLAGVDLVPPGEPAEFAAGDLAGVKFASDAAADKANGLGLVAEDFEGHDPSGATGFTVADVETVGSPVERETG